MQLYSWCKFISTRIALKANNSQRIVLKLLQFLLFLFDNVYKMAFTMVLFILRCIESKYSDKYSNME